MEEKIDSTPEFIPGIVKVSAPEAVKPVSTSSIQPKKFKPFWIILVVVILLILGISGYFLLFQSKNSQQAKTEKVYRVGVLSGLAFFAATTDGFKAKMTELGYIEGKNIIYDVQKAPAPTGNKNIIKKFIKDKVDLILTYPTEAALETKEVTKGTDIPVIIAQASIEGNNLVESVRRPGNNITGVRYPIPETALNRLELLHELAPKAKRIWLPFLKDYPTVAPALEVIRPIAKSLGLTIIEAPFSNLQELKDYLNTLPESGDFGMDAILGIAEPLSASPDTNEVISKFADSHKLPYGDSFIINADYGSMFGIGPNNFDVGELAAPIADKILKGTPAGMIPVVTSENELQINYKVIQKLGLTVNEGVLSRATKIIH